MTTWTPVGKYMEAAPYRDVWAVRNKRKGSALGGFEWYPPWRCWVFSAADDGCVFSPDCLQALAAFAAALPEKESP